MTLNYSTNLYTQSSKYIAKILLACFSLLIFNGSAIAQVDNTNTSEKKSKKAPPKKGDIYIIPIPVLAANPAFGFVYGVGAATSWYLGDPQTTKLSSAAFGGSHTTKNQTIFYLKSTVFAENNGWIFIGDWRYLDSSQPTWGLGTGPQSAKLAGQDIEFDDGSFSSGIPAEQMMEYRFYRFHEIALKKLDLEGWYAGVGIHIDRFNDIDDQLLDTENGVYTSYYYYTQHFGFDQYKSTLVGLSANALYDTRDNVNNPYDGRYALVQFKYNPTWLGSDDNSSTFWMEYRQYFRLTEGHKNILALWTFGNFNTSGTLPYMNLPAIGWDQYSKSGPPFSQGRFRGKHIVYLGAEYRKVLWGPTKNPDLLGMIAFANATTASGIENGIGLFEYIEPGCGLGLRLNISKKARTNLGMDYGWGSYSTTGFYLRINENF